MGFRAVVLVAVLALSGCDLVFPPGDRTSDGPPADADPRHDEDHDNLVDVLDPCPHIAGDDADSDNDGVGDACDPEPTNPRQHLIYFNGFGGDLDSLVASGATSFIQDDLLVLGNPVAVATVYLQGAIEHVDLATHIRVAAEDVTAPIADAMLVAGHPADPNTIIGTSCRLGRSALASTSVFLELHQRDADNNDAVDGSSATSGPVVGFERDVTMSLDGTTGQAGCSFGNTVMNATVLPLEGEVGFAARRLDVRFAYFLVIQTI